MAAFTRFVERSDSATAHHTGVTEHELFANTAHLLLNKPQMPPRRIRTNLWKHSGHATRLFFFFLEASARWMLQIVVPAVFIGNHHTIGQPPSHGPRSMRFHANDICSLRNLDALS